MRANTVQERPYQARIVSKVVKAVDEGHKTIMIEAPTGSGKTVMALKTAEALHKKFGWKIGWTCMRRVLLEQAQQENQAKFGLDCIKYFSTFTDEIPTDIDFLIEDEAQHSASDTATTLFSKINPKAHLAMTATPYRTDRMKLCFSKVIRDAGVRQLIDEGYLSPFHQFMIDMDWTPKNLAKIYLDDKERWGKSVIFFLTHAHCMEFKNIIGASGVDCEVVEGGSLSKQEKQLERFENNEVPILANVFILTEGFDSPTLKTVFTRPGSKGPTVQMCGRALRKHADKPFAQIVQNTKTKFPFSGIASPLDKWLIENDVWTSREGQHHKVATVQRNTLIALMRAPTPKMPKFITSKKSKSKNPLSTQQDLIADQQRENGNIKVDRDIIENSPDETAN